MIIPASTTTTKAFFRWLLVGAMCLVAWTTVAPEVAWAHPEDEFCTPGEDGLDPALCRQLNALQSGDTFAASEEAKALEGRSVGETAWIYVKIGVGHILPGGLDHILFVLALFLSTRRLKSLVLQISAFTVAHTATLGLAASGVVAPPASVVEPLIAATIAFVAVETLKFREPPKWRVALVFGFGLIHGLGFAGYFGTLGLPETQFWSGLIGFNIGVEIGQLAVVGVAALAGIALRAGFQTAGLANDTWRRGVVVPASLLIGATGFWWAIQRVFFS